VSPLEVVSSLLIRMSNLLSSPLLTLLYAIGVHNLIIVVPKFGFVAVDTEIYDAGDVDGFYDGWAGVFVL